MRHKLLIGTGALLVAMLLSGSLTILHAESAGNCSEFNFYILILGIIEDPDPIPAITYEQIRDDFTDPLLDAVGGQRNDGRPDEAFDPETGSPVVTWASSSGGDYDIAFAGWTGENWSEIDLVASSSRDELDPRAHIDSFRKTYIIWWTAGSPDKVFLASRGGGAIDWKDQIEVASDARRPSVVTHDDQIVVAFERDLSGGGQEVIVAFLAEDGGVATERLASTMRSERLDAVVHSSGETLWVDWKNSDTEFAYSIRGEAGWSEPAVLTWTDRSWAGEEIMRRLIKVEVLSP
jgi:hypothetical protein